MLIVENDDEIQSVLHNALSLEGYEVTTTSTTASAIHKKTLTDYDIVIVDFASTGDAGYATAVSARALGIGVILVGSDPVQRLEGVGHAHIMKPVSLSAISELVREVLEQTKADCNSPLGTPSRVA